MVASSDHQRDPLRHCRGAHRGVTFAGHSQRFCAAVSVDPQRTGHSPYAGLFILVLNGSLAASGASVVAGFHVDGFWSAFWGAIVISFVSWVLSAFFRGSDGRVHVLTHHTRRSASRGSR
jgi:hypothetical protein